jgi:two-component system KDP operon response regulator KdpE
MSAKILLVEDESDTRLALTVRLEGSGYTVLHASDGASAVGVASLESPDLIVLDLGLPDHDGYTVMERLKSNFATSSIPVIVLTGRDPERNQERSYEVGALEFYQKPVPWKWFLASIERALARPRSETVQGN